MHVYYIAKSQFQCILRKNLLRVMQFLKNSLLNNIILEFYFLKSPEEKSLKGFGIKFLQ